MITRIPLSLFLTIFLLSCAHVKSDPALIQDNNVYFENPSEDQTHLDRYTLDNQIYILNRIFVYDYYILKNDDTLKITAPTILSSTDDPERSWSFLNRSEKSSNKIESISLKVTSGESNQRQSQITYNYQFTIEPNIVPFSSTTGLVENEKNIWLHPPRDKYFMILELNPFPYIRQPFKKGTSWKWSLKIGDYWKDERWKLWDGPITNNYKYTIVGKKTLHTKLGKFDCWIVEGTAESEIGSTSLTAYFNESYGFLKLDYVNIDKSKVILEIKDVKLK